MLEPDEVSAILRLNELGWGSKRIARELGISRNTVKDYVAAGGWTPYRQPHRKKALFQQAQQGIQRGTDRANGIGHGRQCDGHAFQHVPLGLAIQGLMLTELLEHDHGQEARASPSPGDGMERCRRLADLLAVATGELFPDRLDYLPLARHHFQRPRDIFAELAQTVLPQHSQAVGGSIPPVPVADAQGRSDARGAYV